MDQEACSPVWDISLVVFILIIMRPIFDNDLKIVFVDVGQGIVYI